MSKELSDEQIEAVLSLSETFKRVINELARFANNLMDDLDPLFQNVADNFNQMTLEEYESMPKEDREYVLTMTKKLREAGYDVKGMPPEPEED